MKERSYRIGRSTLTLEFGDLTNSSADVLVSSDDSMITMGGGISAAILRAGGESILHDAAKKAPASPGDVVVTTAGTLRAKYVFHAITIGPTLLGDSEIITQVTARCIALLDIFGLNSIAFPAIGAGVAGFSYQEVATQMAAVIVNSLKDHRPIDVKIYLFDRFRRMQPIDYVDFFEQFAARTKDLALTPRSKVDTLPGRPRKAPSSRRKKARDVDSAKLPAAAVQRQQGIVDLGDLDTERQTLEARLADFQDSLTKGEVGAIEARLREIHRERVRVLGQVRATSRPTALAVFVSYAHADEKLRKKLGKHLSVLERQGLISMWHDRKIPAGGEWGQEIDARLESSRVILLLISADFVDSKYCYDIEMNRAMARHEGREALVIPVILRPVVLKGTPFSKLQALPKDARPATEWATLDSAFVSVTEGLRDALNTLEMIEKQNT